MAKYAVVDLETKLVQNVIEWDGESEYSAPEGTELVASKVASIEDMYLDGVFWRRSDKVTHIEEEDA